MGTAGLHVNRLAGLLERKKIECSLTDGDSAYDHCFLRLSSRRRPGVIAFVEYENQGMESRIVSIAFQEQERMDGQLDWIRTLRLEGARKDDPNKIAEWIEVEYLNTAS